MGDATKGPLLFTHRSDGWELAPKGVVNRINDRNRITSEFALYEKGIELRFFSKEQKPVFLAYSDVKKVLIFTKDVARPYYRDGHYPVWMEIHSRPYRYRIYHSYSLPVDLVEKMLIEKNCIIERRTTDSAVFAKRRTEEG